MPLNLALVAIYIKKTFLVFNFIGRYWRNNTDLRFLRRLEIFGTQFLEDYNFRLLVSACCVLNMVCERTKQISRIFLIFSTRCRRNVQSAPPPHSITSYHVPPSWIRHFDLFIAFFSKTLDSYQKRLNAG